MGWGSGTVDFPYLIDPLSAIRTRASSDGTTVTVASSDSDTNAAKSAATGKDVAIVFITADSGEGYITVEGNQGDRYVHLRMIWLRRLTRLCRSNLDPWHNGVSGTSCFRSSANFASECLGSSGCGSEQEHDCRCQHCRSDHGRVMDLECQWCASQL